MNIFKAEYEDPTSNAQFIRVKQRNNCKLTIDELREENLEIMKRVRATETGIEPLPNLDEIPRIAEFYANTSIFITGGTGFMGKVLIEKLLRSCPKIKNIYLLMREKKGVTAADRLKALFDIPVSTNNSIFSGLLNLTYFNLDNGNNNSAYLGEPSNLQGILICLSRIGN